jgi:hypothetical protein
MPEGSNRGKAEGRSGKRPHEEFLELCAISTTGELTEEEQQKLREHLAVCSECRQALKEFEATADFGVPLLASKFSPAGLLEEASSTSGLQKAAETLSSAQTEKVCADADRFKQGTDSFVANRKGRRFAQVNWTYVWMPLAAALLLMIALGVYSYQAGRHTGFEAARAKSNPVAAELNSKVNALERQISDLSHERAVLDTQLGEGDRTIRALQNEIATGSAALAEMKSAQASLKRSLQNDQAEKQQVARQRSDLHQQLDAAEGSLAKLEARLRLMRRKRTLERLRAADLRTRIGHLSARLRDQQQTIAKQQQLLGYDRDIRDLIAARNLYIAEVYDVGRDGSTRKPFGRIFYTKGKSLIFYAYDLDQQPGVTKQSSFQAWGQRSSGTRQALNLGIFYEDSASGRRWVLKVDNARKLKEIDAVFVTVEPSGGSRRPSGKRLLYAYLRVQPNHP